MDRRQARELNKEEFLDDFVGWDWRDCGLLDSFKIESDRRTQHPFIEALYAKYLLLQPVSNELATSYASSDF